MEGSHRKLHDMAVSRHSNRQMADIFYFTKENEPGIWRLPTGGGDEVRILADPALYHWGDWVLSERGIYYVSEARPQPSVDFFSFASKRVSRIAELTGLPPDGDPGFAVSPDGKRIILSQVDTSAVDIMLVENFRALR